MQYMWYKIELFVYLIVMRDLDPFPCNFFIRWNRLYRCLFSNLCEKFYALPFVPLGVTWEQMEFFHEFKVFNKHLSKSHCLKKNVQQILICVSALVQYLLCVIITTLFWQFLSMFFSSDFHTTVWWYSIGQTRKASSDIWNEWKY